MLNEQRYTKNLEIITLFKNGVAGAELLKDYSGWGGLREAIYTPDVYKELKKVLSQDEIYSLKQTLKNAYYTPVEIVKFMYAWLQTNNFKGGSILEPSVGNGVFIEHMPQAIKENSTITAVELDQLTSLMVEKLYPEISLHNICFEQYQPNQKFDLIIGNPPYGANRVFDKQHADLKDYCIHHYFVAKSMRLLKEGGILAMVLPSFFLDNVKDHVREIIYKEGGDLLAAYRLPDDLFANAKVTVDIVFLTKGRTSKQWVNVKDISIAGIKKPINEYFYNHSPNILGNLEVVDMYKRKGLTCKRRGDTARLLQEALKITKQETIAKMAAELLNIEQQLKELQQHKSNILKSYQELLAD